MGAPAGHGSRGLCLLAELSPAPVPSWGLVPQAYRKHVIFCEKQQLPHGMVKIHICAALVNQYIEIHALITLLKLSVSSHIESNSKAGAM